MRLFRLFLLGLSAIGCLLYLPTAQANPPIEISALSRTTNQLSLTIRTTLTNRMEVFQCNTLTGAREEFIHSLVEGEATDLIFTVSSDPASSER